MKTARYFAAILGLVLASCSDLSTAADPGSAPSRNSGVIGSGNRIPSDSTTSQGSAPASETEDSGGVIGSGN